MYNQMLNAGDCAHATKLKSNDIQRQKLIIVFAIQTPERKYLEHTAPFDDVYSLWMMWVMSS